jgi:signal transduction histidine kinase
LTDNAVNYLQKIVEASKRMSQLINDLLNFSRLSKKEEGFTEVDLNEIMRNIQNDFEIIISQKKASIHVGDLPRIEAIPLQMNQLFYNLMSNALKFTSGATPPEIRIECSQTTTEEKRINHLPEEGIYFKITFADNGIGFDEQYAEKIFEIFQRLHGRSQYEGTGIGLALASKIVVNHKGKIKAQSKEGKGAIFYIYLPQGQPV